MGWGRVDHGLRRAPRRGEDVKTQVVRVRDDLRLDV